MAVDDLWVKKDPDTGKKIPSARHGRGKRWRVRYVDNTGAEKTRLFAKKGDADNFDANTRADLSRGTYVDPNAGKLTLRAHSATWLEAQTFDVTTRQTVEQRLRTQVLPLIGADRELRAIKASTVQAFVRKMQLANLAANYIRSNFDVLSSMLQNAVDDGALPSNPCRAASVKLPTVTRKRVVPWSVPRVMAVADEMREQFEATVYCGYGLGLRQGEIFGLGQDDIEWLGAGREVHVRRQVRIVANHLVFAPPKGGKERDVPLASETSLRLSAHIKAHPPVKVSLPWLEPDGPLVTVPLLFSNEGEAIRRAWFNMVIWTPALVRAGVVPRAKRGERRQPAGMHELRHTYASTLLAHGVDIRALAEYLGHSDPGFTLRTYTHLMPSTAAKARAAIDLAFVDPDCAVVVPDDRDGHGGACQTA